jgi:hypothetical protein
MCRNVNRHIGVHRIPLRVRDDAYVPLLEAGCRATYGKSEILKSKIFLQAELDGVFVRHPSGKSVRVPIAFVVKRAHPHARDANSC